MTAVIWGVSLLCVVVGGALAALFVMMPVSLDVGDLVTGGGEPWENAVIAAAAFVVLLIVTVFGLRLWHTARFKVVALLLTLVEATSVGWTCVLVYRDYF